MPPTSSKRDCWQRWLVTLVSETINSQASVLRERERWSARTRVASAEKKVQRRWRLRPTSSSSSFSTDSQINFGISISSPRIHAYLHRATSHFQTVSYPFPILLAASKPPDLPQAVLVPGSITKSYENNFAPQTISKWKYPHFSKKI